MSLIARLRPFRALVRKDLRVFLSDRRAVILGFIAPLVLASIFASMSSGAGEGGSKIPLLIVDEDKSPLSREVISQLAADANLEVKETTPTEVRGKVHAGEAHVAVAFPKGFGANAGKAFFRSGDADKPILTFLTDPTHAAESGMVRGLLTQHAMQAISRDVFEGQGGIAAIEEAERQIDKADALPRPLREALKLMFRDVRRVRKQSSTAKEGKKGEDESGFGFATPFGIEERTVAAKGQVDRSIMAAHAFSGMAVQFVLFAAIEAGIGLLTERQKGLWRRVRAAPLSRFELLGSKALSQTLITLMILAVLFGFGAVVFHVRFSGSFLGFALVATAYSLTASAFGLLIAALGKTPQAARGISVMAVLLMVLLGGAWIPMFLFPSWVQTLTLMLPTRWAVDGFEGATWRGLGLAALASRAAVLCGFALVFGGLAAVRFRWEED